MADRQGGGASMYQKKREKDIRWSTVWSCLEGSGIPASSACWRQWVRCGTVRCVGKSTTSPTRCWPTRWRSWWPTAWSNAGSTTKFRRGWNIHWQKRGHPSYRFCKAFVSGRVPFTGMRARSPSSSAKNVTTGRNSHERQYPFTFRYTGTAGATGYCSVKIGDETYSPSRYLWMILPALPLP